MKSAKFIYTTILLLLSLSWTSCQTSKANVEDCEYVYICTGKYAKAFHSDPYCKGLKKCKGRIVEVDISDVPSKYHPCRYCF